MNNSNEGKHYLNSNEGKHYLTYLLAMDFVFKISKLCCFFKNQFSNDLSFIQIHFISDLFALATLYKQLPILYIF